MIPKEDLCKNSVLIIHIFLLLSLILLSSMLDSRDTYIIQYPVAKKSCYQNYSHLILQIFIGIPDLIPYFFAT